MDTGNRLSSEQLTATRVEFFRNGQTVAAWAREHGFVPAHVYAVLSGGSQGRYGSGHDIAVALGLKPPNGASSEPGAGTDCANASKRSTVEAPTAVTLSPGGHVE